MSRIFTTTVRFNLDREADRQALQYLQGIGRQVYRTGNQAVIAALNDHFNRLENPAHDTQEKEDALLERVLEAISEALRHGHVADQPKKAQESALKSGADEDMDEAMSFIDGL